jgi:hypothetical protein
MLPHRENAARKARFLRCKTRGTKAAELELMSLFPQKKQDGKKMF